VRSGVLALDEEAFARILRNSRWPDGVVTCIRCGSKKVVKDGARGHCQKYWCTVCDSYFNDKSGTIFQDSKVPLRKWFEFALLMESERSVLRISKEVDIAYRNAYYIAKKLRRNREFRIADWIRREKPPTRPVVTRTTLVGY